RNARQARLRRVTTGRARRSVGFRESGCRRGAWSCRCAGPGQPERPVSDAAVGRAGEIDATCARCHAGGARLHGDARRGDADDADVPLRPDPDRALRLDERDYVCGIPSPQVDGYLTGGTARLVDAQGRPVSLARVMLHHVVFSNAGARLGDKTNPTCDKVTLFDSLAQVPGLSEPVAGFAEEHVNEHLPPGYGYPIKATNHWVGTWMLMNHRDRPETVYLEYTADVVTGESLKPAYPVWLDVRGCSLDPIFDVPGGGRPGSTFSVSTTVPAPFTGRIVAALGHLHRCGKIDVLTEPACGDREVLRSTPTWGGPRSLPYRVRPVLHEPSPVGMSTITSDQGFPVQAGEPLK